MLSVFLQINLKSKFLFVTLVFLECIFKKWLSDGNNNVMNPLIISLFSLSGIANEQKKLYGTQFHPEVDLTERGMEMLRNFLFEIAGCTNNFTVQNRQQTCINEIREKVDKSKVLVSETTLGVGWYANHL